MQKLKILNKKQTKVILESVEYQFGTRFDLDCAFLQNRDGKIYIINKDLARIDESKLKIDSLGLYIGTLGKDGFRPSIEGSQLIGKSAKKNVLKISDGLFKLWQRGHDLETDEPDTTGFTIIQHNSDYFGAGKIKGGKILNHVPKVRRIQSKD